MNNVSTVCSRYLSICEKIKDLSSLSLKAYRIDLEQFEACIGSNIQISAVQKEEINRFHTWLIERDLRQTSIKRKLASLKAMFRWLELEEVIETNPFHQFRTVIKLPKRLPRNVPRQDLIRMIEIAKMDLGLASTDDYRLSSISLEVKVKKTLNKLTTLLALELMLTTGIRVGELSSIKVFNVDIEDRKVKIFGKGSRERYVYLPDRDLGDLVKTYLHLRKIVEPTDDSFLVNSRGRGASTQFLRKLIRIISNRAGTREKVTPHMLRHSAACELLESGLDIRFVQRLLGHSSISTTEIYTHVSDSLLKNKITEANVRGRLIKK